MKNLQYFIRKVQLNFIGVGNTFAVNGNTIDVSIQGSAGGSSGGALDITSCLFI